MKKTVSVIGAGVAGLASAIRLQHAGYDVTLYEKEPIRGCGYFFGLLLSDQA